MVGHDDGDGGGDCQLHAEVAVLKSSGAWEYLAPLSVEFS